MDPRERLRRTVLADARRSDGKQAIKRHAFEPFMSRDRGDRFVRRIGEEHEAIRHRKSGLLQAGAIEGLAAGTRRIGGTKTIEGSE